MQRPAIRPFITSGVALAGSSVIAVTPVVVPLPDIHHAAIQLTAGGQDITLDFVRHGQSTDDVNNILGTLPPGAPLTALGEQQADTVAQAIQQEFPDGIAGIYASELIRTQQSADPLAQALGMDVQVLPGLNEISAGIAEGDPRDSPLAAFFLVPIAAWLLGLYFVPDLGGTGSPNGMAFEENVNNAIDTIYQNTVAGNGPMTDVAYSSGGLIVFWTLMNVKNPDFWAVIQPMLATLGPPANTGQAIVEGNPTDGWTLVSWDGTPVPQTPDLLTGLFVDFRDLITAPQLALWNIYEAIQGGDQADITSALQAGFDQVLTAVTQFPQSVIDTITGALGVSTGAAGDSVDSVFDGLAGVI